MSAIVLFGNLTLDGVDVSDEVTSFKLTGSRNAVAVPASLGNRVTYVKAGSEEWTIEISYRQSDGDTGTVSRILFDALLDEEALVHFRGSITDEVDADNYYGYFTVTGLEIGGEADSLAEDSQTYTLTGRPTRTDGSGS